MEYFKNGWNWVHLFGSCVFTILLMNFSYQAGIFVFALGGIWELWDEAKKRGYVNFWFLDPAGFDLRDWGMDLLGIIGGLLLCK